ncbi:MAG: bifunctional oligoribonuclease/PAP phosphatase NrnA [Clostridia bacterium]|nr:bifunctional oligoribonuclease/PAP phosphatase NrnA [Clostridia bacterium]
MKLENEIEKIKQMVDQSQTVAVVGHRNPDGDSIGSCIAVCEWLESIGKSVSIFVDGEISSKFSYLKKFNQFNLGADQEHFDLLIVLDLSDPARLGVWDCLIAKSAKTLVIDHHVNPVFVQCDLLIDLPEYASTGEIVYSLFELLKVEITAEIASALYTSIACDTGCFLFANTTAYTHHVVESLMKKHNLDIEGINFKNFRAYDRQNIPVITYVLKHIKFAFDGKLAIAVLPYKAVKKWNLDYESRHGLFKYVTDINGVKSSIFLTELNKGEYNISLRSLGEIDVAKIARRINGGGHRNASGATFKGSRKQLLKILMAEFAQVIK